MTTEKLNICAEALRRHHFETAIVETTQEAFELMKKCIGEQAPKIVSFGDSITMRKTGIIDWLRQKRWLPGLAAMLGPIVWPFIVAGLLTAFPQITQTPASASWFAYLISAVLPMW